MKTKKLETLTDQEYALLKKLCNFVNWKIDWETFNSLNFSDEELDLIIKYREEKIND